MVYFDRPASSVQRHWGYGIFLCYPSLDTQVDYISWQPAHLHGSTQVPRNLFLGGFKQHAVPVCCHCLPRWLGEARQPEQLPVHDNNKSRYGYIRTCRWRKTTSNVAVYCSHAANVHRLWAGWRRPIQVRQGDVLDQRLEFLLKHFSIMLLRFSIFL